MHGSKDQLTEDKQVVQKILAGDAGQMNELALRHTSLLERTLVSRGAKPAEAEDLVANLWRDCLPKPGVGRSLLEKYKGPTLLQSWLTTVVTRRLIDFKRRQRHVVFASSTQTPHLLHDRPAPECSPPGEHDLKRLLHHCLRHALDSCSPEELLVLRLVHSHGLTQREVCALWGSHESKVSRLLKQAMRRIERHTLECAREQDPWLDLTWEDFVALCEAETIL